MKVQWVWIPLKVLVVLVILSHLYFEIALIIKLYVKPALTASGDLNYHESLGLFAPVIYMFEGGVKILEGFSPVVKFVREILLIINSVLLIASIFITRYVFKKAVWAGILTVLLSALSLVLWFG